MRRRLAVLVLAVLALGVMAGGSALAQESPLDDPYNGVDPGVEEPTPTPTPTVEEPEPTDVVRPVDDRRPVGTPDKPPAAAVVRLPVTGFDVTVGGLVAAALLLAGAGALLVARFKSARASGS